MRIVTYSDPFSLQNNPEIWNLITSHPHFCAADTLVQGMCTYYGRESFSVIRPISDLLDNYLDIYMDNPVNDMRIYMAVAGIIRAWPDSPLKQSFLFNKNQVVDAIRLLMPLEFDPSKIDPSLVSEEQGKLLEIYEAVRKHDCYQAFRSLRKKTKIDFEEAVRQAAAMEIVHLATNNEDNQKILNQNGVADFQFRKEPGKAEQAGKILANYYHEHGREEKAEDILTAARACELNKTSGYYDTIIIHGVHHFTPEILYLIRNLDEQQHLQVVFLIPYASGMPAVYGTWERAYEWTHTPFEYVEPIDLNKGRHQESRELAKTLLGESIAPSEKREILAYDNLTSFAIHEAGATYKAAQETSSDSETLNRMNKQYYAVHGTECNELLKMFYPDQFKKKPFLSYPIGQLILGIYRMWDFDRDEMIFDVDILTECAVSGLFQEKGKAGETLRKTRILFRGANTLPDYLERIQLINRFRNEEAENHDLSGLKRLSFLDVSLEDCLELQNFLVELNHTGEQLFRGKTRGQINYIEHFKKLMKIITEATNQDERVLTKAETQLIQAINEQLNTSANEYVEGNIQDVRDALAFFLSSRLDKNSSNWIVRDFEQVDGAILLSKKTKAQKYHFAMLSNEHMLQVRDDELPWPLTENLFDSYEELKDSIRAIATSVRERRSFLKFTLFYGMFYSEKPIEFSYICMEKEEKQTPYYLFTAMGYKTKNADIQLTSGLMMEDEDEEENEAPLQTTDEEGNEIFAICPYKYLMNRILGADLHYTSEYHITYFLRYYLTYLGRKKKARNAQEAVSLALNDIKIYFPFLGSVTFQDLVRDAGTDLEQYKYFNETVHRRKLNFLVAGWKSEEFIANFKLDNPERAISNYMHSDAIYPDQQKLPRHSLCDYCNYQGICLRDFYQEHEMEAGVMEEA